MHLRPPTAPELRARCPPVSTSSLPALEAPCLPFQVVDEDGNLLEELEGGEGAQQEPSEDEVRCWPGWLAGWLAGMLGLCRWWRCCSGWR